MGIIKFSCLILVAVLLLEQPAMILYHNHDVHDKFCILPGPLFDSMGALAIQLISVPSWKGPPACSKECTIIAYELLCNAMQ